MKVLCSGTTVISTGRELVTKTFYHTPLPFSRAKCDICIDFDANEYPNIFPPKNAHIMIRWTKNKGVI